MEGQGCVKIEASGRVPRHQGWRRSRLTGEADQMAIATTTSVTEAVAQFAAREPIAFAPDELYSRVTRAFVDTIGVTIAGRQEQPFAILAATAGSSPGQAT